MNENARKNLIHKYEDFRRFLETEVYWKFSTTAGPFGLQHDEASSIAAAFNQRKHFVCCKDLARYIGF